MQKWKFWSAVPSRKSVGLLATVLALASVVGCSSPVEKYDGPQAAAGQYALDHATSDFEREVLGDLMVTREEYVEAIDRYVKCISDNGSSVTPVDQRGLFVFKISGDVPKYDSIAGDCGEGTILQIADYYHRLVTNPENLDEAEVKADCVNRHGGTKDPISPAN